jgi:hypothetical protein
VTVAPTAAGRGAGRPSLVRKVAWTATLGLAAFAVSALLDEAFQVSLVEQLLFTLIVGSVTLLVQYLAEFERTLGGLAEAQRRAFETFEAQARERFSGFEDDFRAGFANIGEATELMAAMERSSVPKDRIMQVVRVTGALTASVSPLALALADDVLRYAGATVKALGDGHEVFYNGEDRELLLGLAAHVRSEIRATSWATMSARGQEFEAGFWFTDLGGRYLDAQRSAAQRGVRIRRIFVYDSDEAVADDDFRRVRDMQLGAGVEVRLLNAGSLAADGSVSDFVLFDDDVSYETIPVARGLQSAWLLTTRLVFLPEAVRRRSTRFEELWRLAQDPGRPRRIDLAIAGEDVTDPVEDVGGQ